MLSVTLSKCFTKSNSTKPLKPYFCWTLLYFCCIFDETENCQHIELHVISSYIESRVNEMENNLCKLYCINLKKMIENLLKYYISYVRGKIKEYRFLKKSIIYPVSSIVFITLLCQFWLWYQMQKKKNQFDLFEYKSYLKFESLIKKLQNNKFFGIKTQKTATAEKGYRILGWKPICW